jgi:hypothetical protein
MASGKVTKSFLLNSVPGFTDPVVRPPHGSLYAVVNSGVVSPNLSGRCFLCVPGFHEFHVAAHCLS